ncbi:unnamed protein product [Pelagomonas calceolata]|uniref:RNA helicase n=1 Tax=Pelagomonas calceolata TaxID=35677 RepID=A0A7S3ZUU4_9STRA|nr:unnamed protein product [Pelagomonas calceolata]|mmetsp:Transcript_14458/g.39437  ORF Transcript_14458/g.39437 Transcript_14458/m.39437 type:complete len:554 (+) Transcript_14458:179-1840(+)
MDPKRSTKKKKKQKRKSAGGPPRELVREAKTYAGPVAGCVFTTVRGVTGYYSDGPRAAPAPKKAKTPERVEAPKPEPEPEPEPAAADEPEAAAEEDDEAPDDDDEEEEEELEGKPAWAALGLHTALVDATTAVGWTKPTRIQRKAIPVALAGRDVIGLAETGSGKTGAFGLPIMHKLLEKPSRLFGTVLAPTRELAVQIHEVFDALGKAIGLRCVCIVGGVEVAQQSLALAKQPHCIIATPGRLVDHLENTKGFHLRGCKCLVMDEADRMLSMDFEAELDAICQAIPSEGRSSMLFSATMTSKVAKLQRASLHKPVKVEVNDKFATPRNLTQEYLFIPAKHKECYLAALLDMNRGRSGLVFCGTCAGATKVSLLLRQLGFEAQALHGKMDQPKRLGALRAFKSGDAKVLVATDVAARGLDIPTVDLVLNYDIPSHGKEYVHRVGRTARAGRKGRAVAFVTQYDVELYQRLEHLLGRRLPKADVDEDRALAFLDRVTEASRTAQRQMNDDDAFKKRRKKRDDFDDEDDAVDEKPRHKFAGLKKKKHASSKKRRR